MKRQIALVAIFLMLPLISILNLGCGNQSKPTASKQPDPWADYPEPGSLAGLQLQVESLKNQVRSLSLGQTQLQLRLDAYKEADLDPTSKGYSRIESNTGTFLIVCENVQPYLNGYQMDLSIGNPYAINYHGFKLTVTWGKRWDGKATGVGFDPIAYDAWAASLHKKDVSFTEYLKAGCWNRVKLILTPASASELEYVIASSMETNEVLLRSAQ